MFPYGVIVLGNTAYAVSINRELQEEEFFQFLGRTTPNAALQPSPLPDNTRWFLNFDLNDLVYVVEKKPSVLPIRHENWSRAYKVALPWQYFIFSFYPNTYDPSVPMMHDPQIVWAPNRLTSLEGLCFRPYLPNIWADECKICVGNTAPESSLPPFERVDEFVKGFFSEESLFNDDLPWEYPNDYPSIASWARASRENALCWMNWNMWHRDRGWRLSDKVRQHSMSPATGRTITTLSDFEETIQRTGRRPTW